MAKRMGWLQRRGIWPTRTIGVKAPPVDRGPICVIPVRLTVTVTMVVTEADEMNSQEFKAVTNA